MEFIVTRFIRMLERDYGITVKKDIDVEEQLYIVILKKLDPKLKDFLLKLRYHPVTGETVIKDAKNNVIRTDVTRSNAKICLPYGTNGIMISFNDDNYGEFVNILDYNIRRYFETHSQIDSINHRF